MWVPSWWGQIQDWGHREKGNSERDYWISGAQSSDLTPGYGPATGQVLVVDTHHPICDSFLKSDTWVAKCLCEGCKMVALAALVLGRSSRVLSGNTKSSWAHLVKFHTVVEWRDRVDSSATLTWKENVAVVTVSETLLNLYVIDAVPRHRHLWNDRFKMKNVKTLGKGRPSMWLKDLKSVQTIISEVNLRVFSVLVFKELKKIYR
jgi:hypothetical protein